MQLALYQPEIAGNVGALIRTTACFGATLHVIEPCGFPWQEKTLRRAAMDYGALSPPVRHASWPQFSAAWPGRVILLTTKTERSLYHTALKDSDILLLGQESAGVPEEVHQRADVRVTIPLVPQARSLNVAVTGAVALGEWHRQQLAIETRP